MVNLRGLYSYCPLFKSKTLNMKKYIITILVLLIIGSYSFFYLVLGNAYITVAIFALSFTGVIFLSAFLIGDIVMKIISYLWKRNDQ